MREWMELCRSTGSLEAKRCGRKANPEEEVVGWERLMTLLAQQNGLARPGLVQQLEERCAQKSSTSSVDH